MLGSASSTIGIGGGGDGECSFDPNDGWTMRSLEISSNSFLESEIEKDSSLVEVSFVWDGEVSSDFERCGRTWDEY